MIDAQAQDEQLVLAALLESPDANRWEIDGLEADLFIRPTHRRIAEAIVDLRDSGRSMHWRRVRIWLRKHGHRDAAVLVEPLVRALGTHCGLTAAISNLHKSRGERGRRCA